jgi:hypothetical protein
MKLSDSLLHFSFDVIKTSAFQFFYFFGTLLIAGLALTWISRWTQNVFQQFKFPKFGLYFFGVFGVPIHELCHAIFATVFFHDIKKIKWFDPKGKGNSYGSVTHHYNEKNFYHRLGLFFIGMGPVLLAPVFLFAAYHFLVPSAGPTHFSVTNVGRSFGVFGASLVQAKNWSSVGFYGFLYFTVCITSQMELSPEDFKIARGGIFPFFSLCLVASLVEGLFNFDRHGRFQDFINSSFSVWVGFSLLAVFIALLNLLLCLVLMNLGNKLMGAKLIHPFRR